MSNSNNSWSLDQFQVPEKEGESRFHDFDLALPLMQGIASAGFQYCTPIQANVLHHTLAGADAIGRAQTGTGKTAAFLITVINDLLKNPLTVKRYAGEPRALIVAPTRELAQQIEKDARQLVKHTTLKVMSVVGGMNLQRQQEKLNTELVDILVATPGRLLDFANRRDVWLDRVEVLVLDEADRMLDMGFIPDVKRIVSLTPKSKFRQTLLFSATFNQDVMNLAKRWTETPSIIEIEPEQVTTDTVDQKVFIVETEEKFDLLLTLIKLYNMDKVMIFANRRDITRKLCERLQKEHIKAQMISGDVPQIKRSKTLENFRSGKIRALVATDVAGRGIHIDGVSHVVNYNLPEDPEDYVHRIGRTGRAGQKGMSISFACEDDAFLLPQLEQAIGMKLECEYPPKTESDVAEKASEAEKNTAEASNPTAPTSNDTIQANIEAEEEAQSKAQASPTLQADSQVTQTAPPETSAQPEAPSPTENSAHSSNDEQASTNAKQSAVAAELKTTSTVEIATETETEKAATNNATSEADASGQETPVQSSTPQEAPDEPVSIEISPQQAKDVLGKHTFLDIRDPMSFANGHIEGAFHLNNDSINPFLANTPKETPLVIYCHHGHSSLSAVELLKDQGFNVVQSLHGGFELWKTLYPETTKQPSDATGRQQ